MSINRTELFVIGGMTFPRIDNEEKEILRRLYFKYGVRGTGNKANDKALLHRLEMQEAKKEESVSSKFLTVTKGEQEKIQAKKKERRIENHSQNCQNSADSAKALGEQIYLAIQMKAELDEKMKRKVKK